MTILKTPETYAALLIDLFGDAADALAAFNDDRNSADGRTRRMPQMWCSAVADELIRHGAA